MEFASHWKISHRFPLKKIRLLNASRLLVTYLAIRFHVVEMIEPNAFALPGGHIYVSRGLLALVNSEHELANVLAHEVAHVALGHHLSGERLLHDGSKRVVRFTQRLQRHQELVADRYGALYLVRAGLRFTAGADALRRIEGAVGKTASEKK